MPDSEYFFHLALWWESQCDILMAQMCMEFALAALAQEK
jgi:hypothetical protein